MGGTLEKNGIGPYEIVEIFSKGTMKLKNCSNGNLLKTAQHASNLKIYVENHDVNRDIPVDKADDQDIPSGGNTESGKKSAAPSKKSRLRLSSKTKDKSAIQKLMKDRELITENAIEIVHRKLPGKVVNIDINELKPYLDNDALLCLESTVKMKVDDVDGAYNCPIC